MLETPQGSNLTIASGGLAQAEYRGRLVVAQFLEMPERQDLAVNRVHGVEGLLELDLDLSADRGSARGEDQPDELGGDRAGVGRGKSPPVERQFASSVSTCKREIGSVMPLSR